LKVRDREFAVGDQVVCGKNALQSLGVANASRGQVVAVDLEQRAMTLQLEDDGRTVRRGTARPGGVARAAPRQAACRTGDWSYS
jgi:hypothetical protein